MGNTCFGKIKVGFYFYYICYLFKKKTKSVGKNDYLNEFKYFNPWITHTGVITWVPEVRLHTKCIIKVIDFPFDTQCCELSFYSWAHSVKQMTIRQFDNKNKTNVTHLTKNTEWRVYNTYAGIRTIITSEDYYWWVSTYSIFIERDTSYHFYNLLMPCFGRYKLKLNYKFN